MKFRDYVERWKVSARNKTSDSWKMAQDQILSSHVLPIIGGKDLNRITAEDISLVLNTSKEKGHAPNTTKKIFMVLSKVFGDAVEFFEFINKSPVKRRFHLPFVPPSQRPYMGLEQSLIVLEYVMNHPLHALPIWIMLLAGLRISEIEPLEWSDIDFENDEIVVSKSHCIWSKKDRPYTKNKNQYRVPMAPMLRAFLWNRKELKGLVCRNSRGGMVSRWSIRGCLCRLSKQLNLPIRSSHGLRHSCARIFVEKGARDEDIKELLGHKWLQSAKTYTHRDGVAFLKKISKKIA